MSSPVPTEWITDELVRFCDIVGGGTPDRAVNDYWGGQIPWVSPTEVTSLASKYISKTKEGLTQLGLDKSSAKLHPPGTLLMTSRASIGYVAINTVPMATNQGFQSLRCKDGTLADYMYQYITWVRPELERLSAGSTFSEISSVNVKRLRVTLPPRPEQQKIATILSSVDDVIEKTRAQIDKLKDLKTAMMQELLTKGIGHTEFKDSPVGQVPEGWQLLSMRDICSVRQGLQIPISERHSKPSNNRWVYLTIRYINTGFDKSVAEYIENPKSSVVCTEDDIILARTGATGKVVTGINGVFHNNFFMVDYDRVKTVKNFLVQYLNSPFVQHEISNRAGTTTIPDLNHGDFYTIPMILPPVAEQLKLAEVLESLDILISNKISKYAAMEKAKKALMQDLLTGKVRVKPNKSAAL